MYVGNWVNWWKLARNSCFICGMQQRESFKLFVFTCKRARFVETVQIEFSDNSPTFPIMKSLWSCLKLLLICLLELGFGFDNSLPRGQPNGKSPYYRSFDRNANWRVNDSIPLYITSVYHAHFNVKRAHSLCKWSYLFSRKNIYQWQARIREIKKKGSSFMHNSVQFSKRVSILYVSLYLHHGFHVCIFCINLFEIWAYIRNMCSLPMFRAKTTCLVARNIAAIVIPRNQAAGGVCANMFGSDAQRNSA